MSLTHNDAKLMLGKGASDQLCQEFIGFVENHKDKTFIKQQLVPILKEIACFETFFDLRDKLHLSFISERWKPI